MCRALPLSLAEDGKEGFLEEATIGNQEPIGTMYHRTPGGKEKRLQALELEAG